MYRIQQHLTHSLLEHALAKAPPHLSYLPGEIAQSSLIVVTTRLFVTNFTRAFDATNKESHTKRLHYQVKPIAMPMLEEKPLNSEHSSLNIRHQMAATTGRWGGKKAVVPGP